MTIVKKKTNLYLLLCPCIILTSVVWKQSNRCIVTDSTHESATQQIFVQHTGFFMRRHVTHTQPSCGKTNREREREPRESHTTRILILCCQNKRR